MPNHIDNNILIIADDTLVKKIRNEIRGTELQDGDIPSIDFDKIIAMPKELAGTSSPAKIISLEEYEKNQARKQEINEIFEKGEVTDAEELRKLRIELDWECKGITIQMSSLWKSKYGADNWYDWNIANWGTKWGAYSCMGGDNSENQFFFQTAWSFPQALMLRLSLKYPEAIFLCSFADEDTGSNCGIVAFKNGNEEYHNPESICIDKFSTAFAIAVNYGDDGIENVEQLVEDECYTEDEAKEIIEILESNHPLIVAGKDLTNANVEMFTSQINF